ncbi:hypothetical protein Rsub_05861 [Raphidocelis subcapitata]|uniref:SH3 domain-containing protein n=1 Tax=Raphidocelis subcapitata TaxID=307507 RepID=A0A2V0P2L3_9CHLO|nr:hypothetical protein Rsub_05861 [Raphidocelis subcapitata]|eukprot:GBF93132.1 hypothetical protein Rsub_05861 [Raphidocelis subcapitata]
MAAPPEPSGTPPAPPAPVNDAEGTSTELVPNLNLYVLNFADCARALAAAATAEDGKETVAKVLPRLVLFGALPPSILPVLLSVRSSLDVHKNVDKKLLRLTYYLIQLACSDGSAGTTLPFSVMTASAPPVRVTDVAEDAELAPVWADAQSEAAAHYQRTAAFRQLAALARAGLTSDPDDPTLIAHLMAATATTLDRCDAARRKKLPFFGSNAKLREVDRRQTLERVAAQRVALSAARVGLPQVILSSKIAPRALSAVNSPDPLCARHALALAALVARDAPALFIDNLSHLVQGNLDIFQATGSMSATEAAAAMANLQQQQGGGGKPIRPPKDIFQEKSANLADAWSRLYLARACGAVASAGYASPSTNPVLWEALTTLACCDRAVVVCLEAIRGLVGAPYPTPSRLPPPGSKKVPQLDERREQEDAYRQAAAWRLLLARAADEAPAPPKGAAAAAAAALAAASGGGMFGGFGGFGAGLLPGVAKQFTVGRSQRGLEESAALKRLASLGGAPALKSQQSMAGPPPGVAAVGGAAGAGVAVEAGGEEEPEPERPGLLVAVVRRLCAVLAMKSHAAIASACRAVAALAEARARAAALARSPAERAAALGSEEVREQMGVLQERMLAVVREPGFSAPQRLKALEALLWLQPLPTAKPPLVTPEELLQLMSLGGGSVPLSVATIFADPWPEDLLTSFLFALTRRLFSAPGAAEYLLACAAAVARACPSRVKHEQLHQMWDTCLRASVPEVKLAAVRAALALASAPAPAIASPPSAAAPEVKVLAAREEAAYWALVRSAVWWLGENANFATNEFAWRPRGAPAPLAEALETADGVPQELLAAAAVAVNPLLSLILTHLQRAMLAGSWEVRMAAAQAVSKVAVRSGEPFRVQCYSMLATARSRDAAAPPAGAAAGAAAGAGGAAAPPGGAADGAAAGGPAGAPGGAGRGDAAAGLAGEGRDPLGVAACVGPALEVLDHMYGGEVVVQELIDRFGRLKKSWPKKLLRSLEERNAALIAAICERVCFVPKELFWPLGPAAKDVLTGHFDDEAERDAKAARDKAKKEKKAEEAAAAEKEAAAGGGEGEKEEKEKEQQQQRAERSRSPSPSRRFWRESSDEETDEGRQASMLGKLKGYDYEPQQAGDAASSAQQQYDDSSDYPEEPLSEYGRGAGAASDDDSDIVTRRATVLYDFDPQEEDEVAVAKGQHVEVVYEVGGWIQVITPSGTRGLVPRTYVNIHDEDEARTDDARSVSSRASSAYGETQADAAADYNQFLSSRTSFRLSRGRRSSTDSATFRRTTSSAPRQEPEDEVLEEEVDPSSEALAMGQVQRLHPAVDRLVEQVEELDDSVRRGGAAFNQPQYAALRESATALQSQLEAVAVMGQARLMRSNLRKRAAAASDKLEALRRGALSGGPSGGGLPPPGASPGPGLRRMSSAGSEAGAASAAAAAAAAAGLPPLELPALQIPGDAPRDEAEAAAGGETYQYTSSRARVVYAFEAEAEGELTVGEGEAVWVEAETDGWFTVVREADGVRGLVPASYVEMEGFS